MPLRLCTCEATLSYYRYFDNWDLASNRWVAYAGSAVSNAGTLTLDTNVDGPAIVMPMFTHAGYNQYDTFLVYKHTVMLTGDMRLGFSTSWYQPSLVLAGIEAHYDGTRTSFTATPTTLPGWDGSVSIAGGTFEIRVAMKVVRGQYRTDISTFGYATRVVICDTNGVPIPGLDTDWLGGPWYAQNDTAVGSWSNFSNSYYGAATFPCYIARNGVVVLGQQTCFGNASQAEATTFLTSGTLPYSAATTPTITVTPVSGNVNRISIAADAGARIWLTIDDVANAEGVFGSKNRYAYTGPFNVQGIAHIRAGAAVANMLESAVADAWVGTTALNPTPEIAPPSTNFDVLASPIEVKIAHVNPAAVIRYTVDGSEPTAASLLYQGSFNVRGTTKVKAVAFIAGTPSPVTSQHYVEHDQVVDVDTTTLDAFVVNSGNAVIGTIGGAPPVIPDIPGTPGTPMIPGTPGTPGTPGIPGAGPGDPTIAATAMHRENGLVYCNVDGTGYGTLVDTQAYTSVYALVLRLKDVQPGYENDLLFSNGNSWITITMDYDGSLYIVFGGDVTSYQYQVPVTNGVHFELGFIFNPAVGATLAFRDFSTSTTFTETSDSVPVLASPSNLTLQMPFVNGTASANTCDYFHSAWGMTAQQAQDFVAGTLGVYANQKDWVGVAGIVAIQPDPAIIDIDNGGHIEPGLAYPDNPNTGTMDLWDMNHMYTGVYAIRFRLKGFQGSQGGIWIGLGAFIDYITLYDDPFGGLMVSVSLNYDAQTFMFTGVFVDYTHLDISLTFSQTEGIKLLVRNVADNAVLMSQTSSLTPSSEVSDMRVQVPYTGGGDTTNTLTLLQSAWGMSDAQALAFSEGTLTTAAHSSQRNWIGQAGDAGTPGTPGTPATPDTPAVPAVPGSSSITLDGLVSVNGGWYTTGAPQRLASETTPLTNTVGLGINVVMRDVADGAVYAIYINGMAVGSLSWTYNSGLLAVSATCSYTTGDNYYDPTPFSIGPNIELTVTYEATTGMTLKIVDLDTGTARLNQIVPMYLLTTSLYTIDFVPSPSAEQTHDFVEKFVSACGMDNIQCSQFRVGTLPTSYAHYRSWTQPATSQSPTGLLVTDPAGLGVYLKEPLRHAAVTFRVRGPFKYKVPGTTKYFMLTPDNRVGIGTDSDTSQLQQLQANTYLDVRLHFPPISYSGQTYFQFCYQVQGDVNTVPVFQANDFQYMFTAPGGRRDYYGARFLDPIPCFAGYDATPFHIMNLQYANMHLDYVSKFKASLPDSFFTAALPLTISAAPVVTPASGDLSTGDVTVAALNGDVYTVDRTSGGGLGNSFTIGGNLSVTSAPMTLSTTALENGKLRSAPTRRVFFNKRTPTWITDPLRVLENWDVTRSFSNWTGNVPEQCLMVSPDSYELNYGVDIADSLLAAIDGVGNNGDDGRFSRAWDSYELSWNNAATDNANVWFQTLLGMLCSNDFRMIIGFKLPASTYQIGIQYVRNRGALANTDSLTSPYSHSFLVGLTRPSDWTWQARPVSVQTQSANGLRLLQLRWGRRVSDGALRLQLVRSYDGSDAYDSGWVAAAAGSARPWIRIDTRRGRTGGQTQAFTNPVDGHIGVTDTQLANLLATADVDGLVAPVIGAAQPGSSAGYSNFPVSGVNAGTTIIANAAGLDSSFNSSNSVSFQRQTVSAGPVASIGDFPSPTTIRARVWKRIEGSPMQNGGYGGLPVFYARSAAVTATAQRATADFLRVSVMRRGEVEVWADTSTFFDQFYLLRFDDGSEYPFTFDSRAVQKVLGPGQHWVKLVGTSNRDAVETTPLIFSVPADGELTTVIPASVSAGAAAVFQASAVGGSGSWDYRWEFSDSQVFNTASASIVFTRPGRYRYTITASDSAGNVLTTSGTFVVPFAATVSTSMLLQNESRIS